MLKPKTSIWRIIYSDLWPSYYDVPFSFIANVENIYETKYMTNDEITDLLVEVRIDLTALKKSGASKDIKEQLKWALNCIDIIGCELVQNIAKKLKE